MDCLVLPVSMLRRRPSRSRHAYRRLHGDVGAGQETPVTVVVGKEKKKFFVEPFVLEEGPFRILMEFSTAQEQNRGGGGGRGGGGDDADRDENRVVFVDVDSILFEHMLWLMHNDCSSLFRLNVEEIIDFYAQDF